MTTQEERDEILKQRRLQYGSFEDNMKLLMLCLSFIEIYSTKEVQVARFIKNMLALKAARSYRTLKLGTNSEPHKDCINDFKNYMQLFYEYDPQGRIVLGGIFDLDDSGILNYIEFENQMKIKGIYVI